LPLIEEIVRHHAERTVFTRFLPPSRPEEMPGTWQRYYRRWREMTLERTDPELLELVPTLARADAIVITGAETDVCVLAAVLGAVDFGYRVVIASDAICSSADATHDALLKLYESRFSEQIEIAETELILASWRTE
jgi:nicotinamidase-related amidase